MPASISVQNVGCNLETPRRIVSTLHKGAPAKQRSDRISKDGEPSEPGRITNS